MWLIFCLAMSCQCCGWSHIVTADKEGCTKYTYLCRRFPDIVRGSCSETAAVRSPGGAAVYRSVYAWSCQSSLWLRMPRTTATPPVIMQTATTWREAQSDHTKTTRRRFTLNDAFSSAVISCWSCWHVAMATMRSSNKLLHPAWAQLLCPYTSIQRFRPRTSEYVNERICEPICEYVNMWMRICEQREYVKPRSVVG